MSYAPRADAPANTLHPDSAAGLDAAARHIAHSLLELGGDTCNYTINVIQNSAQSDHDAKRLQQGVYAHLRSAVRDRYANNDPSGWARLVAHGGGQAGGKGE